MDKQKRKVTIVGGVVAVILIILLVFVSVQKQNLFGRGVDAGNVANYANGVCGDGLIQKPNTEGLTETCDDGCGDDNICTVITDDNDGCSWECAEEKPDWDCTSKGCSWSKEKFEDELRKSFEQYEKNPQTKPETITASLNSIKKYLQNR